MLVDFNIISNNSRIWIYASEQRLITNNKNYIINYISDFLKSWEAHKVPLRAGVTVLEDHFIVVALDESRASASGCSIDALHSKINEIEIDLSISLLNRMNVFCLIKDEIKCITTDQLSSIANIETLFYDITIQKKSELDAYLKPINKGWCKLFF